MCRRKIDWKGGCRVLGARLVVLGVALSIGFGCAAAAGMVERIDGTGFAGVYLVRPAKSEDGIRLRLFVLAGEADNAGTEGMAHYVEHLAWLSARAGAGQGFDSHSNARVTARTTSYWISGEREHYRELIEVLLGVLEPFELEETFMRDERGIIQLEYQHRVSENPYAVLHDELRGRAHGKYPLARSVVGRLEDIASFSVDEARALHQKTHRPENAVLVVQGDVPRLELVRFLRLRFEPGDEDTAIRLPDCCIPRSFVTDFSVYS